jgi:hypothetical protein
MKALVWNNDPGDQAPKQSEGPWKTVTDPFAFSFGLVPPANMSLQNAIDLQDVINVSDEARIVTQSAPPFSVVHVNRAFLEYADFPGHDTLVGRPVESMFQVTRASAATIGDSGNNNNSTGNNKKSLNGKLLVGKRKACRLQVIPVVDRSRRRRTLHSRGRQHSFCMSHVLIQVLEPLIDEQQQSYLSIENLAEGSDTSCSTQMSSLTSSDNVVGTIG